MKVKLFEYEGSKIPGFNLIPENKAEKLILKLMIRAKEYFGEYYKYSGAVRTVEHDEGYYSSMQFAPVKKDEKRGLNKDYVKTLLNEIKEYKVTDDIIVYLRYRILSDIYYQSNGGYIEVSIFREAGFEFKETLEDWYAVDVNSLDLSVVRDKNVKNGVEIAIKILEPKR